MSVFTRFKKRVILATATVGIALAGIGMAAASHTGAITVASPNDCDANAVIWCGADTSNSLQTSYKNGDGHNTAASIQNIYTYFKISSADIASLSGVQAGTVNKDGSVYVGNTKVATDALTAGRTDIAGSTKVVSGGVTFYTRKPSVSFATDSLPAYVVMQNGIFKYAIIASCGNPVIATSVVKPTPHTSITKEVAHAGKSAYAYNITVMSGEKVQYRITVTSDGNVPAPVTVNDTLPAHMGYTAGTLMQDGKALTASQASQFFSPTGLALTIANGSKAVFTFDAVAGTADTNTQCTTETLPNVGKIISTPTSSATATVTKLCQTPVLTCDSLTATAGKIDSTSGATDYTFAAKATATNATVTSYVFSYGDGSQDQTVTTNGNTTTATHTFKVGTWNTKVTVNGKDSAGKSISAPVTAACATAVTVKTPECKPGVPAGSPQCSPSALTCSALTATAGSIDATTGNQSYSFSAAATADNAKISTYTFDFGDGKTQTVTSTSNTATASHTFVPGAWSAKVTVSGKDASGTSIVTPATANCAKAFTVKVPECKPGVPAGSPQCAPAALTCDNLAVTPGVIDNNGNQSFTFTAAATPTNVAINNYKFVFSDNNTVNSTSVTTSHTFAPGNWTATVTVSGTDASGSTVTAAANANCSRAIIVKSLECKPGVPATNSSCYTCDAFTVSTSDARTAKIISFGASPATSLTSVVINWGDSVSSTYTPAATSVGQTHQYAADGTYQITATAHFNVNGQDTPATGSSCTQSVTFTTPVVQTASTTPTQPKKLADTGAGSMIGLFGATVVVATLAHRLFLTRRLSGQK